MKYTICETLVWALFGRPMKRYLEKIRPGWDAGAVLKASKRRFRAMIAELPDIGTLKQNSLRLCLSGGAVWLSIYESTPDPMTEAEFGDMVRFGMDSPVVTKVMASKDPFTPEAQRKAVQRAELDNTASDSEFSWNREVIPGRDGDEYTTIYRRCGLCALGKKEGHPELIPYLCALDVGTVEQMGGTLFRTKTLANGGDCCDFYCCKKGSEREKERLAEK